jgi:hypothetical protein
MPVVMHCTTAVQADGPAIMHKCRPCIQTAAAAAAGQEEESQMHRRDKERQACRDRAAYDHVLVLSCACSRLHMILVLPWQQQLTVFDGLLLGSNTACNPSHYLSCGTAMGHVFWYHPPQVKHLNVQGISTDLQTVHDDEFLRRQ